MSETWARTHGITLVGGSVSEQREGREKLSNTCVVCDPEGEIAAVYRKIHLFDVEAGGFVYRESDAEEPGDEPVVAEIEGWPVGLTVCYDIRFPELYRVLALEGALLFTVPAHFTLYTGKDHWELLLRARAVENQCFLAAAARSCSWSPIASHFSGRTTTSAAVAAARATSRSAFSRFAARSARLVIWTHAMRSFSAMRER